MPRRKLALMRLPPCTICVSEGLGSTEHSTEEHKCELCQKTTDHNVTISTDEDGNTVAYCVNRPIVICKNCKSRKYKCPEHKATEIEFDCIFCGDRDDEVNMCLNCVTKHHYDLKYLCKNKAIFECKSRSLDIKQNSVMKYYILLYYFIVTFLIL